MNIARTSRIRAFTIIELLMVIAIMAVVAGLIVGLAGVSTDSKKIKRTETELANMVTLIEAYKAKVGVYPPSNPNPDLPHLNTLLYELAGAVRTNLADPYYGTPFGSIRASALQSAFGVGGLVNARDETANGPDENRSFPILRNLGKDQSAAVVAGTLSLVVPVDGANGQRPNPWCYRVGNPGDPKTRNPESFDLWVEINLGKTSGVAKTKIIGNWKN